MQGYGYGPSSHRQEVTYYVGPGVQVTSARFVVGAQMYPLAGITSVSPYTVPAARVGLIVGAAIFGFLSLGGLMSLFQNGNPIGFLFCGAITGLFVWRAIAQKAKHGVVISTAGMQMRALQSDNAAFVHHVVGALHQAIASR